MKDELKLKKMKAQQTSQKKELNRFLKTIITDWPAKIICIVLAVLLYMICKITSLEKRNFAVPLEVTNAGNLTYSSPLPHSVRVSVRGNSSLLGTLSEKDFRTFIDTGFYVEEGSYRVPIHLELSDNATMIEPLEVTISPEYLTIDFEKKVSDLKQIKVNTTGSCAKGYEVTSISVEPELVQVSGNSRQVNSMTYLETNVINLSGKKESFTQKAKILNQNPLISLSGNTDFVVKVNIVPVSAEKVFETSEIYYLGLTSLLKVENPNTNVKILVKGTKNELEEYKLAPRSVYVDCSDIFEVGEYELPLVAMVPPNFELAKIEPEKIKIKVIKEGENEKESEETSEQNLENEAQVENSEDAEQAEIPVENEKSNRRGH